MKKILLAILPLIAISYSYAQNTFNATTASWAYGSGQLSSDPNGAIELGPGSSGSAMPYIDWHFGLNSSQDYNVRLMNSANNRFDILTASNGPVLTVNGGNVGIGMQNPGSKLVIAPYLSEGSIDKTIGIMRDNGTTAFGGYIGQRVVSSNNRQGLIVSAAASLTLNAAAYNIDFTMGNIVATTDANLAMRITSAGKVAIGTPDPGIYLLAVKGPIHTQSVQVDMNDWSDYVFKPSYKLTSLSAVKRYIDQNHHLPDVPSEDQVKKEGIDLGEMNSRLLKKIEELTLYLIEKDDQLKQQQQVISRQQQQLNKINRKLSL